jgi:hypothetical protein
MQHRTTIVSCACAILVVLVAGVAPSAGSAAPGLTWTPQINRLPTTNGLVGIACPSATTCFAVGDVGTVLATGRRRQHLENPNRRHDQSPDRHRLPERDRLLRRGN